MIFRFISIICCFFQMVVANNFVKSEWALGSAGDFVKQVRVSCSNEQSYLCSILCESEIECIIEEGYCPNCIGNSIFITNLYTNIAKTINAKSKELDPSEWIYLLKYKEFVSFQYNSVYNILTEVNSKKMQRRFLKLCPKGTKSDPIIFAEYQKGHNYFEDIHFVVCDSKFYSIDF